MSTPTNTKHPLTNLQHGLLHHHSGIPANPPDDFAPYTVPFVKFPDGSYLMDSLTIVKRLEAEHPEPALPLETELAKAVSAANSKVVAPLWAILLAGIRRGVVSPGSDEWFKKDRERRMGQPEEVFASEQAKAQAFKAAEPRQAEVAAFLEQCKKDDGPFLRGSQVSYADFGVAGWVEMLSLIGGDLYQKCIVEIPGMLEVRQACQPWFERKGE